MKGKLPVTGLIQLESDEKLWNLLINRLINEVKTSGIIEKEPGVKVRVNLIFKEIYKPGSVISETSASISTNFLKEFSQGLSRLYTFLFETLEKECWFFFGYMDGEEKIPVAVLYFKNIKMTLYSQKLRNEEITTFLPTNIFLN